MANRFLIVCGGSGSRLLGQRRVLGMSGELHVDVSSEIKARPEDQNSIAVRLDEPIGTVQKLLEDMEKRIQSELPTQQARRSAYVQNAITHPADVAHARFLIEHSPSTGFLRDGLAQAPAIGGTAIRHVRNMKELENKLRQMTTHFATNVSEQNPLDVWIVSSTAGGTGEGTHRFVGALLADTLGRQYVTSLKLNFIRIGALTYRSVNQRRTTLNTFFGVAADAAFELKFKQDFRGASINWFYVDLPDVGITSAGGARRAETVEMACKAIMLDELADDMGKLLINNQGMRMVVTRTGYWGRDFGENLKYAETLKELVEKLNDLIQPNYSAKYIESATRSPEFKTTPPLQDAQEKFGDVRLLTTHIVNGWVFPKVRVPTQMTSDQYRDLVGVIKNSLNQLLDRLSIRYRVGEFGVRYTTMETVTLEGQSRTQEMELRAPQITAEGNFDSTWVRGISDAHRVKAWCGKLLEGDTGLKVRLLDQIKLCVDAVHSGFIFSRSNTDKAKKLANLLPALLEMLEQTSHLMVLSNDIDKLLNVHLTRPKDLLRLANDQLRIAQNAVQGVNVGKSPILAAELADPLDRLTNESWLCLLNRAAQQGRLDVFKREVLRGATGLSKEGLLTVLELEDQADATRVRSVLQERMGLMRDIEGNTWEAQWWQSMRPEAPTMSYQYRILPKMDPALQTQLAQLSTGGDIRYIYTGLGVIGLYVLAFHGVSLNASPGPDTLSAPAYLLAPMVPVVREVLDQWRKEPKRYEPSGQFELVSAGVIGEPLYRNALAQIGLTEDEIAKIGEYYQLF